MFTSIFCTFQERESDHSLLDISGPGVCYVPTDPMFSSTASSVPQNKDSSTSSTSSSPKAVTPLASTSASNSLNSPNSDKAAGHLPKSTCLTDQQSKKGCQSMTSSPVNITEGTNSQDYNLHSHLTVQSPGRMDLLDYSQPSVSPAISSTAFHPQARSPPFLAIHPAHVKAGSIYSMEPPSGLHGHYYTSQPRATIIDTKTGRPTLPVFPGPEIHSRSPHTTPSPRQK